ncbi:hypothetical protein Pyrde_1614 [Pyrodictium delaneyi]|uniref:Uncharacterized protein n=1 Tax=Pyrodictium delaneyi TaxID=1273541 RepID=A0A0N7JDA6_9CREN|nr:hypothetical protein [Pyrodictium delaneyi]ALL01657.1 hypothetical protein Pyrde_1614 [Pyrodictium delaneyi]OWJ55110.1 hypothetical protein Pdsh_05350 [Pyrodictium delaneyi]
MIGTVGSSHVIHAGIILTATGVSRCIEVEAYATLTLLPRIVSIGVAVAVDVPVIAQACGLGTVGAVEDVEIKVWGRGLYYSNPALGEILGSLVSDAYANDGAVTVNSISARMWGIETAIASLEGSSAVIEESTMPLYDISGLWAVIFRLGKPLNSERLVETVYSHVGVLERIVYDNIDDAPTLIDTLSEKIASISGIKRLQKIRGMLARLGALAVGVDIYGKHVIALVEDAESAYILSAEMRELGDRVEAPVIVPGI